MPSLPEHHRLPGPGCKPTRISCMKASCAPRKSAAKTIVKIASGVRAAIPNGCAKPIVGEWTWDSALAPVQGGRPQYVAADENAPRAGVRVYQVPA